MHHAAVLLVACIGFLACNTIPAVPTQPLAGQTPQQEDRDARECVRKVKGAPSYEACMISRRYKVVFHLLGDYQPEPFRQEMPLIVEIAATESRTPEQVTMDIESCRAEIRKDDATLTYAGYIEPNKPIKLAERYATCMEPRGYKTTRWEPKR